MKIKSLMLCALLLGSVAVISQADTQTVNTVKNEQGNEPDPMYGGYKYKRITGTAETTVCAGPCLLGEIYMTPGSNAGKVDIFDTVTTGWVSSTPAGQLMLTRRFVSSSTSTSLRPKVIRPMRAKYGITAQMSTVGSDEAVVIAYIELDDR